MELLVSVSLIAVLLAIAVPSFQPFFAKRAATAGADMLVMDYRFARSEALRRTNTVTICRSLTGTSCASSGSWHEGWIVFVDPNNNQSVDTGEEVLRVQNAVDGVVSIHNGTPGSTKWSASYRPTGLAISASESLVVTVNPSVVGGTRLVCLSNQGRPALRDVGAASPCS